MSTIRTQLSQVVAAAITIAASLAVLVIAPNATAWAHGSAGMPQSKTVCSGSSGINTVLFKFVAAETGDLSPGKLYAAQAAQNQDQSFGLEWIELGNGRDAGIAEAIASLQQPE